MKHFAAIMVFMTAGSFAQVSPSSGKLLSPLDQTLITNTKTILEAQKNKDADPAKRTLSDDFVQIGSEGRLHPKAEFLDEARDGGLKGNTLYNLRVRVIGPNTAIVSYNAIIEEPEGDTGTAPRYQIISDLWVKDGENWKLKFQQATPLRSID